jgi:transposase
MNDLTTTHVGMDVHQDSIAIAALLPGRELPEQWQTPHTPQKVKRLIRRLKQLAPGELRCCYEAGSCGFVLQRLFTEAGVHCDVIAPSLIPRKPGERIKTDKRDAIKLAGYLRGGNLTVVTPPSEADEAARDLCRARGAAQRDQLRQRHRVLKLLMRHGMIYRTGKNWTQLHLRWLHALRLDPITQIVLNDLLLSLEQLAARIVGFDEQIAALSQAEPYRKPAEILRCFKGIDTLSAMILLTEMHDVKRFGTPQQLMAYAGLIPGEHSTGTKERRGGLVYAGNAHLRRALVEAAWHYRHPARIGQPLAARRKGQPGPVIARADKMMQRGHRRYWRLSNKGKSSTQAVCAIARELAGFIWAALQSPVVL